MYVIVAGGGKVGANVMRSLVAMGHEVTLIEQARDRFESSRRSSATWYCTATRRRSTCSSAPASRRPPDIVLAATGDDEDNIVICQLAREGYGVPKAIARVNDPRNQQHFDLLGITQTVCATSSILGLVEHEVPEHGLVQLLELRKENLEIVEVQIDAALPRPARASTGSCCRRERA